MAEFSRLVITNKGQALLAKMMTGEADVEFTKISVSDKEYTLEELNMLTELTGVKQTAPVAKITRTNNVAITIETSFDNTELTQGYYMRALGLYAIDPDDGEILYAVTTELAGCCYMPAYNGITISGACIKLVTTVGNAENVSLEVDPGVYATVGEIKELRECVDGFETWKDNTQKRLDNWGPTIVGHGQVINSLRDSIGNLKPVATSGDYNDLANRPSIPNLTTYAGEDDQILRIYSSGYKVKLYIEDNLMTEQGFILDADKASIRPYFMSQMDVINVMDLGSNITEGKWRNIYTVNGIIQTSDRNEKNAIQELPKEKAKSLIYGLKPSTYKMNAGTSGRTHWGMISQDIEELLEEIGMTSLDFAGFIKSQKVKVVTKDENGNKLEEPIEEVVEGEHDYSLRYDEFIAPIIKVIQSQHEEIETLKQETAVLKRQLSDLMKRETV